MLQRSAARAKLFSRRLLVVASVSASLLAAPAGAQADPDKLQPDDEPLVEASEPRQEPSAPASSAPSRQPPPRPSTAAEVRALLDADPRAARPILRRAARTATDPDARALGLLVLVRVDPGRATARICARALRIDPEARVRRAAAECLGRLPAEAAQPQTPSLLSALSDEALDVQTMAGWALATVGDASALGPVTARASDEDPRVARLFYDYARRLRARHGAPTEDRSPRLDPTASRAIPSADALMPSTSSLETTASVAWLALYGGMAGWLHGGLFPAAHGGAVQELAALTALGGAVSGVALGGAYGFFRARELTLAHNIVQLGTFGTLAGYGAGLLSARGPQAGVNMASYSLSGLLVGTGVAVAVNEAYAPTPGALALGVATGFGSAVGFGSLALSYGLPLEESVLGTALLFGGAAGAVTTILASPYPFGLLPIAGATVGGLTLATSTGVLLGIVETAQLFGSDPAFTPGIGWAVAGAYVVGASTGAALAMLVPDDLDPFLAGSLRLNPPTLAVLPDVTDPRRTLTLASLGGVF